MPRLSRLLSSTALAGACFFGITATGEAAEIRPLGSLDIDVGGFLRSYALIGDLKEKTQGQTGSYDLRNDTEVYVYARGTDEATGLEYGGNIELEADTNSTGNADETYVFVKSTFGEVRLGDEDGVIENFIVGGATMAAFAGGLDSVGPFDYGSLVYGITSDDATKVIYYSPSLAGFQLGASFTPHLDGAGNDIATTDSGGIDDFFEGGVTYTGEFGNFGVLAGVTAGYGHFNENIVGESEEARHIYGGAVFTIYGFKVGGGYGWTKGSRPYSAVVDAGGNIGDFAIEAGAKAQFYNVGVGTTIGPANVSLNWGQTLSSQVAGGTPGGKDPEPYAAVLSADYGLAPGLVVGGELAWFENNDNVSNNDGILGLAGIRLAF